MYLKKALVVIQSVDVFPILQFLGIAVKTEEGNRSYGKRIVFFTLFPWTSAQNNIVAFSLLFPWM